jgi:hypothetical protein
MKLSEVQNALHNLETLTFVLPDGQLVPAHFHVTEVGTVHKHFIDCGGTIRNESKVSFQLWEADDFDHKLAPKKLAGIIELSINKLQLEDQEVEVEYQSDTIGKYGLAFDSGVFHLIAQTTACLALDQCGVPAQKPKVRISALGTTNACSPQSGCC